MSPAVWLGCAALGALGALARAEASALALRRFGASFPWGTLAVNLGGAFMLGALHGCGIGTTGMALAGSAFLGSLTTFSTWMLETVRLLQTSPARASANLFGAAVAGVAIAGLGEAVGALL